MTTTNELSSMLQKSGRDAELLEELRELLEVQQAKLGPKHPDTLGTRGDIMTTLRRLGRLEEAVDAFREVLPLLSLKRRGMINRGRSSHGFVHDVRSTTSRYRYCNSAQRH